ncbi:MAG: R2-like ligand-binding oxidase [Rhodothermales bacterium]
MRTSFASSTRGLNHQLYPMRLWTKAKRLGTWDPSGIDLTQDKADWQTLNEQEQDVLLRLTAQFQGGEESVTLDLLPLLHIMGEEGRIEEELFLTAYLWEEAKHVEGFDRVLREVMQADGSQEAYFGAAYRQIFFQMLPEAMHRLRSDASVTAQAEALVTYQMIVEGVLAETGYHGYYTALAERDIMPGLRTMIQHIQRDESRHIGYGLYVLARLIAEHGDVVWNTVEARMQALMPVCLQQITETLSPYGDDIPFNIDLNGFLGFGMGQFQKRYERLVKARSQSLEDVLYG